MRYIVDTCVWSQALRRAPHSETEELRKLRLLIEEGEVILMPGMILQEVLQGIRDEAQFHLLREILGAFPFLEGSAEDYAFGAELFNSCRSKGIQAATIDFLIAALAIRHDCALLTADADFQRIAKHADLRLL